VKKILTSRVLEEEGDIRQGGREGGGGGGGGGREEGKYAKVPRHELLRPARIGKFEGLNDHILIDR